MILPHWRKHGNLLQSAAPVPSLFFYSGCRAPGGPVPLSEKLALIRRRTCVLASKSTGRTLAHLKNVTGTPPFGGVPGIGIPTFSHDVGVSDMALERLKRNRDSPRLAAANALSK